MTAQLGLTHDSGTAIPLTAQGICAVRSTMLDMTR